MQLAMITLRVLDGADRGRTFEDLPCPVTIGREEGNVVQLNDERVSRFHLKIQEDQGKIVLTDLESTNGTKVNGEDVQLRILRYGDVIAVGRSVLLYGSREQIAQRLASLRGADPNGAATTGFPQSADPALAASLDFELNWSDNPNAQATLHALMPPELPERLSPGQAAQLSEFIEYMHIRVRDLLAAAKPEGKKMMLEERRWQNLIDLQARLAGYLRSIGEPADD
jgi:pSer/pThr/pTyr-binding forkhead associated (FHA) protein